MKFLSRHKELTLRTPEPTSIARAKGFNKVEVNKFYNLLMESFPAGASHIWNMDETGIRTSSTKPPKIISQLGKKQVGSISNSERGQLITAICCCNAAGNFLPPVLISPRKRLPATLLDGAPPDTKAMCSDSGWTNNQLFRDWMQHFVSYARPNSETRTLLILDNHESHKDFDALQFARENGVTVLSLPPHTSHKLQPLDVTVFGPLSTYYERAIFAWQKQHPHRMMQHYDVAKVFEQAYTHACTPANAIAGFRKSGIYPLNPLIFPDSEFLSTIQTSAEDVTCRPSRTPATTDQPVSYTHLTLPTILLV